MEKLIIHKKQFLSLKEVTEIKQFYDLIGDSPFDSRGPYDHPENAIGWQGCYDRSLHLEIKKNPIHKVIEKLKDEFGNLVIYDGSIRYLCAPFLPHSDVRNIQFIKDAKLRNLKEGFIFIIPIWWSEDYKPGTAFYSNPCNINEPHYTDLQNELPRFSEKFQQQVKNFSVKKICYWENPGDLIAWENFQYHGSCGTYNKQYDRRTWIKEFISIETWQT
jgi:hypothetical protein